MQRVKLIILAIVITLAAPAFAAAAQRPLHAVIAAPRDAKQDAMKKETIGTLLTALQKEPGEAILISYGMQIYHEGRVSLAKGAEGAAAFDHLREAPRSKLDLAVAVRGATSRAVIAAGANDRAAVVLLGSPGADYRKLPLAEVLKLAGMPANSPVLEGGLRLPLFLVTIDPKAKGITSTNAGPLTIITTGATPAERNAAIARVAAVIHKAPTLIPEAAAPKPVNVLPPPQEATKATSRLPIIVLGTWAVVFAAAIFFFLRRKRRRAADAAARAASLASDASPAGPVPLRHLAAAPKPRMFQVEITVGRQAPHTIPLMLPAAGSALSFDIPGTVVDVESLPPGVARLTVSGSGNCAIAVLTDEVPVRLGRHVLPPDAEYRLPPEEKLYIGNELSLSVTFRAAERETARPSADPIQAAFGR